MRTNTKARSFAPSYTWEGAVAKKISPELELRRSVMANMLFENSFYEDGVSIADRIAALIPKVKPVDVARIAVEARTRFKLRHVPLLLARELARGTKEARLLVADTLEEIIQRPDELTEFLSLYWKDKRQPLSAQVKKGLARAFVKFNEYSLSKYNQDNAVKLRDAMFLAHPNPRLVKDDKYSRAATKYESFYRKLANKEHINPPDTWEVALSAGADKRETFQRLISEKKLGALALLRNLRNMKEAGVPDTVVEKALSTMKTERVLPFRFLSAAKYAPHLEPALETAMFKCLEDYPKLSGKTILLVDASGSMQGTISAKSELTRLEAASALAILLREISDNVKVFVFSDSPKLVPARRGFALRDAINSAAQWSGTNAETAKLAADREGYDRLIILTDEQSHQSLSNPLTGKGYVINVAAYQNGVGYGAWNHIDGWSEAIIDYILTYEDSLQEWEK